MSAITEAWATRPGQEWLDRYWASAAAPHRTLVASTVAMFAPFASLCEIGSGCGPNLRKLALSWPDARYVGIDVSPAAVAYGRARADRGDFGRARVVFEEADAFAGDAEMRDEEIVLCCYALCCGSPSEVARLFGRLRANPRLRGLILIEPTGGGELVPPLQLGEAPMYYHNLPALALITWPHARCRLIASVTSDTGEGRREAVLTVEVPS